MVGRIRHDRVAQPGVYRLVAEVDGEVVGMLGRRVNRGRRAHAASLGMMVHDAHQGRGVATALLAAASSPLLGRRMTESPRRALRFR